MATQSVFWSLVKHDMKLHKRRRGSLSRKWRLAYGVVLLVAFLMLVTLSSPRGTDIDLQHFWFLMIGLVYMTFGLSIGMTVNEWKNNTVGWWLALPLSRLRLLTSKFIAVLLRTLVGFVSVYVVVALLGLCTMLLTGSFTYQAISEFLVDGLKWNLVLISLCPFVAAYGVLFAVVSRSRLKPATPLMWILLIGVSWLAFSQQGVHLAGSSGTVATIFVSGLVFPVLFSWALAYVLIHCAAYLLDRQLSM